MGVELRRGAGPRNKKQTPPILSHEFVIQNHGDIMLCILMLIALGFFFGFTTPIAAIFVLPQYNESVTLQHGDEPQVLYQSGIWDLPAIFFYTIVWITGHCILQEYFLDKIQRRLHMSKARMSKFNESGHLSLFAIYSVVHACSILYEWGIYRDVTLLWNGYPDTHRFVNMSTKLYFILHISFWVHQFPELYFQKVRHEDIPSRVLYSTIFVIITGAAYWLGFVRIGVLLLCLESILLAVFHSSRALYFAGKTKSPNIGFKVWNFTFLSVRFTSVVLSILAFWYGFGSNQIPFVDVEKSNFNVSYIRINILIVILGLQLFNFYNFLVYHFSRYRSTNSESKQTRAAAAKSTKKVKEYDSDAKKQK